MYKRQALGFDSPKAVYESGVTGFHLCRELNALGLECAVGASSKMQRPPADVKRKNDLSDAQFLARLLATHNVTEVFVPDAETEAARDLVRAHADARADLTRARQRLNLFLMRHGHVFCEKGPTGAPVGSWTKAHWAWIRQISFPDEADEEALAFYIAQVRHMEGQKRELEKFIRAHAREPRWRGRVDAPVSYTHLELARVEWHGVGGVCRRVYAELEAARGASRFDGVRRIGIDETSYKKGHKYVTVVVDHDRGCLIWAHEGTGKDVLNLFLDELTREQRRAIEVVTADGARRIGQLVKRRCPNARWVMDPFHVVQWMNDALDAVRCEEWNAARAAARAARPRPEGKRGRPAKGELPPEEVRALEEEAASIKGSRYALVKNPEDLTDGQRARLEALKKLSLIHI